MKKSLLIRLHLYLGLFTAFYLIAFGFSSIILNHHVDLARDQVSNKWNEEVLIDVSLDDRALAGSIRDQLEIMGHIPWWEFKKDSISFQFKVVHFGSKFQLDTDLQSGRVNVARMPQGFWSVLNGLHFLNGQLPNASPLVRSWKIYQQLTLLFMIISVFLGVWIWLKSRSRKWSTRFFIGFLIGSIVLMILL